MALPKPVWTDRDTAVANEVIRNPSSLIWKTWNEDPIKVAILRAVVSCQVRVGRVGSFGWDMVRAMARTQVCSLHWKWRKCITEFFSVSIRS